MEKQATSARRSRRILLWVALPIAFFCVFGWCCYVGVQRVKLSRPLVDAVKHDDLEQVRSLLDQGADPGTRDTPEQTDTAAHVWQYLLHLDSTDLVAAPVLQIAIFQQNDDIARLLISRGAPVNAESYYWPPEKVMAMVVTPSTGHTALMDALYLHHEDLARLLLERGADPNKHPPLEKTPLMLAIDAPEMIGSDKVAHDRTSSKEMVKLLVERGADVRTMLQNGDTALRLAIDGDFSIVPLLVAKGGDPNTRSNDRWRRTLLIEAAVIEDGEGMKSLIAQGADVNATDAEGRTALLEACGRVNGNDFSMVGATALLEHQANVNAQDKDGNTALMEAAGVGRSTAPDFDAVKLLIEHGADPILKDKKGRTAYAKFFARPMHDEYDRQIARFLHPAGAGSEK